MKNLKRTASSTDSSTNSTVGFDKSIYKSDKTIQKLNTRIKNARDKIDELATSRGQYLSMYGEGGEAPDEKRLANALFEIDRRLDTQTRKLKNAKAELRSYKKTLKSQSTLQEKKKEQRELDRLGLKEKKESERQERRRTRALEKQKEAQEKLEKQNKELVESYELADYQATAFYKKILRYGIKMFSALTKAGAEYDETNSRFVRILGDYSDTAEKYANRIANTFGRNLTEVRSNMTDIYIMLKNSNIQGYKAVAIAANLTAISNELASVWDTDVSEAVEAVISGLQGLPKGMKKKK